MSSNIFQNENIFHNNKKFEKGNNSEVNLIKPTKSFEINDKIKNKALYRKSFRENSFRTIKIFNMNKIDYIIPKNEINKKTYDDINHENKKMLKTKSILPLLNNEFKSKKKILLNQNTLIKTDIIMNNNTKIENNSKCLYLEYKKENSEPRRNNEATYIEIDPFQIILALNEFQNIRQIMRILTKKINQRNIKSINKNNSDSKINIDDILNYLEKSRKDNSTKNANFDNSTFYYKDNFFIPSTIFLPDKKYKNNYSIQDLFLLDIINKVIKKAIAFHDREKENINEDFMIKEYKNQIN